MRSGRPELTVKTGLLAILAMTLAACSGNGSPTPPGMIGSKPPSILDSLPPADGAPDQSPTEQGPDQPGQNLDNGATDALPPANKIASQQPSNIYQVPASSTIMTFEPMVGAPKRVARELSSALGLRIAQHALPVVARSDSSATHRIKGYFTAEKSGNDCLVSYVWDIFDTSGKRINRVTGSQRTTMVSADPWDSVKGDVLDKVAVDTAAKLKSWHTSI